MTLMGSPVLSSAFSTVAAALPLWLTETVALNQFGVIITMSLSVSFVYAALMLVPLLSMLGPQGTRVGAAARKRSWARRVLGSTLTRAAVVSGLALGIMVRAACTASAHPDW
jgi:multidrug efflux pump subunit AcrB